MKQLITLAVQTIYSEQFDMEEAVKRLAEKRDGVHLLRAYVAIYSGTRLTEPLCDADVDCALEQLQVVESHLDTPAFDEILEVYKELAEIYWLQKQVTIMRSKLAYHEDEYSYEGMIYKLSNEHKRPITIDELEKAKEYSTKLADLSQQIQEKELEALKESDSEEYQRYKDELEIQSLQKETDLHDALVEQAELEDLANRLKQKLQQLLTSLSLLVSLLVG